MTPSSIRSRQRSGFTLIELLVVMAIIATLASLGLYGIPRILRQADVTSCKGHLQEIFKSMFQYQSQHKGLSMASGPEFVLSIWPSMDHTAKDAEIFFCPSRKMKPAADLSNVVPELISYTGPNQQGKKGAMGMQDRKANDKVIVCDRCIGHQAQNDEELDELPHAATGLCFVTLGGAADFIEAAEFGEHVIIGPESPITKFQNMVPDDQ